MSKNQIAGKYISSINDLLGLSIKPQPIYQSKGLKTHMLKSKHYIALKYIDKISEILEKPDYIGVDRTSESPSIIYIKIYDHNIQLVVKTDSNTKQLYIATMYDLPRKKLDRMLYANKVLKVID